MKIRFSIAFVLIFGALAASAQTAAEIIAQSLEVQGGVEKWRSFENSRAVATLAMQGMEFQATILNAKPNKMRLEISVLGQNIVQAYDGTTAWMINPLQGGPDPQVMPDDAAESLKTQEFQNALLDYESRGSSAVLDGKETIEGTSCHKIKLTKKDGTVEYHFIDAESMAPIMTRTAVKTGPAAGQFVETFMSDYQEVDGVMVPFFIEAKLAGQSLQKVTVKEMKFNVAIPETSFAFPKK